ncbi:hypothetical protein BJG92_02854 [Arthrobacter sp. SO5]|uniref:hypothetical protein n=1 Tax=Arthrobacter sp. SO5 TaxID=1897055 RepID=UPI001E3B7180|nr:hypothetical protein [Arthrobacter sp. SO5]MCB5275306.1 hypothetical protein [Arthrobacter sp. SO5]
MDFELRTIRDCPNSWAALELFRKTLTAEGHAAEQLTIRRVTSEEEAVELQFHGSPSFIADGRDLFPAETAPALSCRLYRSGHGLAGLPSAESLRAALLGVSPLI